MVQGRHSQETIARARELYAAGLTSREVGGLLGVPYITVTSWCRDLARSHGRRDLQVQTAANLIIDLSKKLAAKERRYSMLEEVALRLDVRVRFLEHARREQDEVLADLEEDLINAGASFKPVPLRTDPEPVGYAYLGGGAR